MRDNHKKKKFNRESERKLANYLTPYILKQNRSQFLTMRLHLADSEDR